MLLSLLRRAAFACAALLVLAVVAYSAARSIPEEVNIKVFAKPQGNQLELLVRVPLSAVKDIQFPARGDQGYLDINAVKSMLPGAARFWVANCFDVYEDGELVSAPQILSARITPMSDLSFNSYPGASSLLDGPDLASTANTFWDQVWLDIRFAYPLKAESAELAIQPRVVNLGVHVSTDVKYLEPSGNLREYSFEGDPGLFYLNPSFLDAAKQFLRHGAVFVFSSADFLLFLFCLALPFRNYHEFSPAIIAFGGALTVALFASTYGLAPDPLWFRPLIATLVAVAILLAAFANITGHVTPRRRALFALGVGFVFGFACSFNLAGKLEFGGSHFFTSVLGFDLGILFASALAGAVCVPTISFLFSFARTENLERIIVSALAADTAWGWFDQRWTELSKVPFQIVFDAGALAVILRILAVLVLLGGLLWFVNEWLKSRDFAESESSERHKSHTVA